MNRDYKEEKLTYRDGILSDSNGNTVMMDWEREIMRRQAATVCSQGGRVLNIGFGLGIIDSFIQEHDNVTEHWIIEGHPDVQKYMIENGWLEKAKCIFKPWQEVINHLPQFDGIYIDTWAEDLTPFYIQVQWILKPNGVFSFFNNARSGGVMEKYDEAAITSWGKYEIESFEIPYISPNSTQKSNETFYWDENRRIYHNPIVTHDPARQYDAWRIQATNFMKNKYGTDLQGKSLE